MWLKLFRYNNSGFVAKCTDKYEVRNYVANRGLRDILVNLIGVYNSAQEIDWESLPEKFVLKWNFGSGYNIICEDKSTLDIEEAIKQLDKWERSRIWLYKSELQYKWIPKKIICEEFIETSDGHAIEDYKFFCSNGEPKFLIIVSDKQAKRKLVDFYDLSWNWIPVRDCYDNAGDIFQQPNLFEEMLNIARKLSAKIPLVRIDLYINEDKIFFGEMTFTPTGCKIPFEPHEYDDIFGSLFPIENELEKGRKASFDAPFD